MKYSYVTKELCSVKKKSEISYIYLPKNDLILYYTVGNGKIKVFIPHDQSVNPIIIFIYNNKYSYINIDVSISNNYNIHINN